MSLFVAATVFFPHAAFALVPNDPFATQPAYDFVKLYDAWDFATGSLDVVVAIIDNGFDTFHPDLRDNVWKNVDEVCDNNIDDDANGYVDDCYGWNFFDGNNNPTPDPLQGHDEKNIHHATIIAGIIGAVGDNNKAGAGINWHVKLMNVKVLGNNGSARIGNLPYAIHYAVDNGADVINTSLVGQFDPEDVESQAYVTELLEAVKYAYDHGVVFVAAAGNSRLSLNTYPHYPVCADDMSDENFILGVSAVSVERMLAVFSNVGSNCIDITAPGVGIGGLLRYSPTNGLRDTYSPELQWNGTSFAAPFVSGAAALIKSVQPGWGPSEIFDALFKTVSKTPPENEEEYANLFGHGLLQIGPAVQYALSQPLTSASSGPTGFAFFRFSDGFSSFDSINGSVVRPEVIHADDVAVFDYDGTLSIVTASHTDETNITFYTESGYRVRSFSVPTDGPVSVRVGNVFGGDEPEVVVSPQESNDVLFWVYDFKGTLIKTYKKAFSHTGTTLSLVPATRDNGVFVDIVVSYIVDGHAVLHRFDDTFQSVQQIAFPGLTAPLNITTADLFADGSPEYVLGVGVGDAPYVYVYSLNGKKIQSFLAAEETYRGGIAVIATDYLDQHPGDELFVSQLQDALDVSLWDGVDARLLDTFYPFSQQDSGEASDGIVLRTIR